MSETNRFHPARWTSSRQYIQNGSVRVCVVCGKIIGERVPQLMLNELVLVPDPCGCCEVRKEVVENDREL